MSHYQKPPELYEGLRLHQNENTGGCSPRVIEALARLRPDQIGFYPPYAAATDAVARYLGVPIEQITLVNGLDEGIMALAVAYLRASIGGPQLEAIVPEPAFEIFRFDTAVAGGRLVQVMPHAGLRFPAGRGARGDHAEHPRRVRHQPEQPDRRRRAARGHPHDRPTRSPPARWSSSTRRTPSSPASASSPSSTPSPTSIVGRTFSKAFGLAGLADRLPGRRAGDAGSGSPRHTGLQRQRRRGGRDSRGARRSRSSAGLPASGR